MSERASNKIADATATADLALPGDGLESAACPMCGCAGSEPRFSRRDRDGSNELFYIVACGDCGMLRVDPRPTLETIGRYYGSTYSWKADEPVRGLLARAIHGVEHWYRFHLLRYQTRKMRRFTHARPGAEILDIGCGSGDRLLVYQRMGYSAYGVEISQSADYARDHLNLRVRRGTLLEAHYEDNQFDVVTLYNVLEHLHDPEAELAEIHRILKPGGAIVVDVPNRDCLQMKWFGERWSAFDVPRDLHYWNPAGLKQVLERRSFEIDRVDQWTNWLHPPMIVLTLAPGLDPRLVWANAAAGRGSGIGKRLGWGFLTLATIPFAILESLLGRGSAMVFYARKKVPTGR